MGELVRGRPRKYPRLNAAKNPIPHPGQRICNNHTGYKGVVFVKSRNKWEARCGTGLKKRVSRRFDNVVDAAQAYDDLAREMYGSDAFVNFPLNGEKEILKKDPGYCAFGHEMTEPNTHFRANAAGPCCLQCLKLAHIDSYLRKIA